MNLEKFETVCEEARNGSPGALLMLIAHAHRLREMCIELSEGLEDESLLDQVGELVGEA